MKQKKILYIFGVILIAILLNMTGKYLAVVVRLPFWMDTLGTCVAACALGPVGGAVTGALSNISFLLFDASSIHYTAVSAWIGLLVGILYKRNVFEELYTVLVGSLIVGTTVTCVCVPLDLILYEGSIGNLWGDALREMLQDNSVPSTVCTVLGQAFVDIPDKMLTLLFLFGLIRIRQHKNYKSMWKHVVLIVFVLAGCSGMTGVKAVSISGVDYVEQVFNNENKMASSEANDIVETKDGYIWIGAYAGLYRYDGKSFERMGKEQNITNVTCLYVDQKGRLLVGTNDSGVQIYEDGSFFAVTIKEGLPVNSVRSFAEAPDGTIYIGTTGETAVLHPDRSVETMPALLSISYVMHVKYADDTLFGVANEGTLFWLHEGRLQKMKPQDETKRYTCLYQVSENTFYAGTNSNRVEVLCWDGQNLTKSKTIATGTLSYIKNICADHAGTIWFCADSGIGYLQKKSKVAAITGLSFNSSVEKMVEDYEGNYWFASSRLGTMVLMKNSFVDVTHNAGLPDEVVNATCLYQDQLYVATDNGLLLINEKTGKAVENKLTKRLKGIRIRCLMKDSKEQLWLSTFGPEGLLCVSKDGTVTSYNQEKSGTKGNSFRSTFEMTDKTIVAASNTGITFLHNGKVVGTLGKEDGLTNPQILSLQETADHKLLAGSDGDGIFVIENGEIKDCYKLEDGLTSQIILRMTPCEDGFLIVTGNSLCYLDGEGKIRAIMNFPYSNNLDAIEMPYDTYWILSSAGIYIVKKEELLKDEETLAYRLLGSKEGLNSSITANSWNAVSKKGCLYLSCSSCVLKIDADNTESYQGEYRLSMNSVLSGNKKITPDKNGTYRLQKAEGRLVLNPVVLDYTLNNPYVRYYLEGVDKDPITVRFKDFDKLVYTNLSSGSYTFMFQVLHETTMEPLNELKCTFVKERKFYESLLFRAYLICIVLSLVAFVTWGFSRAGNLAIIRGQYEQIQLARDEAEQANKAKSQFLANMSHEIRTPMNAIIGISHMALKKETDPQLKQDMQDILDSSNQLLGIVNDILDFSKIESGKMELVTAPYSLYDMLHEVLTIIRSQLGGKPVVLKTEIAEDIPDQVIGDEIRIRQILINLLNNALKFTSKGSITCSLQYEGEGDYCFQIRDTGCGIKEEDQAHLFEAFERVESQTVHVIEGTGLGLSIVKQLVDLMDGSIVVNSEYGKGTCFTVRIRQQIAKDSITIKEARKQLAEKERQHREDIAIYKDARVLVVDDNAMNLKVAKGLLEEYEITVTTTDSGEGCLELCREQHFDLIFLDHMMPNMDGIETLHRLKSNHQQAAPVVVMTANAIRGAEAMYREEGFDDYLSKPLDQAELDRVLAHFLKYYAGKRRNEEKQATITQTVEAEREDDRKEKLLLFMAQHDLQPDAIELYAMGDIAGFYDILDMYVEEVEEKTGKLTSYLQQGDCKNYKILVHAIKSNCRYIGADVLAEEAYALEQAGKRADLAFIEEHHESFLRHYSMLVDEIRNFMKK